MMAGKIQRQGRREILAGRKISEAKGKAFGGKRHRAKFNARAMSNLGFYEDAILHSSFLIARKKLPPIKSWKPMGTTAGAAFFEIGKGKVIAVKPEYRPFAFNKIGVSEGWRDTNIVLTELMRRRIRFEVPLGRIRTSDGRWYYVTQALKGISLEEKLAHISDKEAIFLAERMGQYLGKMAAKGVAHLEPSPHNWIVDGKKVSLVDAKYVAFKEDFPYQTRLGTVLTFEKELEKSLRSCATWLPKAAQPAFFAAFHEQA